MFNFVRTITLDVLGTICMACKSCILLQTQDFRVDQANESYIGLT